MCLDLLVVLEQSVGSMASGSGGGIIIISSSSSSGISSSSSSSIISIGSFVVEFTSNFNYISLSPRRSTSRRLTIAIGILSICHGCPMISLQLFRQRAASTYLVVFWWCLEPLVLGHSEQ